MAITVTDFGVTKTGETVKQYTLENASGMKAVVLNLGAVLKELYVPDRDKNLLDVVWGYEDAAHYEVNKPNFGATIGRTANRIGRGQVEIGGVTYEMEKNNGENNLHGGYPGYHIRMWKGIIADDNKVEFSLVSPDGDQGLPGNAKVTVSYKLTNENELQISYKGTADKDTVMSMTNHSYFNLEGQASDSVLEHQVWLSADAFTPTDAGLIPTGEIVSVEGTPLDFRQWRTLGTDIEADYEPLKLANGYDHNFVLKKDRDYDLVAKMRSLKTGIVMEVYTDQPGMQLYTSNFLNQEAGGKNGKVHAFRSAACFETQHFPDAVHHDNFPSILLEAGKEYQTRTSYRFVTEK